MTKMMMTSRQGIGASILGSPTARSIVLLVGFILLIGDMEAAVAQGCANISTQQNGPWLYVDTAPGTTFDFTWNLTQDTKGNITGTYVEVGYVGLPQTFTCASPVTGTYSNGAFSFTVGPDCYGTPPAVQATGIVTSDCSTMTVTGGSPVTIVERGPYLHSLGVSLIDPIADNVASGTGLVSDPTKLAAASHVVEGVAADSATQALVQVGGVNLGDTVQITLSDESGLSADGAGAGYLTALSAGGVDSRTSGGVITVTAVATGSGTAMAFAVYHAPSDFVRAGNTTDPTIKIRTINLGVSDTTAGTAVTQPISIVRPPVILVHGLFGRASDFRGADGGVLGDLDSSGLFTVSYGRYDGYIGIFSSSPSSSSISVSGNVLGFKFGAQTILPQIRDFIVGYKAIALLLAAGPTSGSIAAVQADIVGHSMGGNVTRTLPQLTEYATQSTYNAGYVHKLITIDTPHWGSPLASAFLNSNNACVHNVLAIGGLSAFDSVTTKSGNYISGAVGDLQPTSSAILAIHTGNNVIPTAMIGAQMQPAQLNGVGTSGKALVIRALCPGNPLAQALTAQGWPNVVGSSTDPSDAIVPLSSQFDHEAAYPVSNPANSLYGVVHSAGAEDLGFSPPTVLDHAGCVPTANCVPTAVIKLLNTPVSAAVFEVMP